jgi:hypothetical protein
MWHRGQGAESARQFQALTRVERLQVQAFLKTLVAPASAGSPEVSLAVEEDARAVQQELQRPRDEAVSRQPTCRLYDASVVFATHSHWIGFDRN